MLGPNVQLTSFLSLLSPRTLTQAWWWRWPGEPAAEAAQAGAEARRVGGDAGNVGEPVVEATQVGTEALQAGAEAAQTGTEALHVAAAAAPQAFVDRKADEGRCDDFELDEANPSK